MRSVAGGIDGLGAVFDDGSLVADGGLLLAGTVMSRLGLEALIDDTVRPGGSAGSGAGRKVPSLVASVLVGGCCIDDAQRLRSGSAAAVLPLAPSTLGTFLRSFTFGHVRQLDKALESAQMRAWSVGAAPSVAEMTVDLDSTVCEVCGKAKHGAAYGHTKVLGYHPLVAVRSDTGEVLHSRMRSGSSQRGNVHFARETLARLRRLAAHAAVTVRADAGFFSYDMIAAIGAHNACYSITIPQNAKVKAAIAAIDDDAWASIEYTRGDKLHGDDGAPAKLRLIVRRTRLLGAQGELWPNWRYHCFVTDRHDLDTKAADANHRGHATVELAIRDLKEGSGLSRCPSRRFPANGARLACCVLAHNLIRWTARLGRTHPTRQLTVAATIPNRLLTVPGRLVNHSHRHKLGGFKWSLQHLDVEVCDGQAVGVVGEADGETGDEVAGASADSSGCGAGVLGEDRRGAHKRGRGDRVRGVGFRRIALVPRTWGNANSRAGSVYGALPVLQ